MAIRLRGLKADQAVLDINLINNIKISSIMNRKDEVLSFI